MNITEMLLKKGDAQALAEKETGTFKSRQLAKAIGSDKAVEVEFEALSPRRVQQIKAMGTTKSGDVDISKTIDAYLVAIMDGVTNIDLKSKDLRTKFGCNTPKDLAETLFGNEIEALGVKILAVSQPGEDESEEDEVKN